MDQMDPKHWVEMEPSDWLNTYAATPNATDKRSAIFRVLQDHAPHHIRELTEKGGNRFGGRIHELRKYGRPDIRTIFDDDGTWYQLIDHSPRQGAMEL